jgi:tRNA (cytosine38-C5)-methyltransferase
MMSSSMQQLLFLSGISACFVSFAARARTRHKFAWRCTTSTGLRVIEFFSGIGGMRLAIPVPISEITAVEISLHANACYKHNFCGDEKGPRTKLIEQLSTKFLDGRADLWTMSPPCQPFSTTKGALRKDIEDSRCKGFLHLIDMLGTLQNPPFQIVLENVVGFYGSIALEKWKAVLASRGYTWLVLVINPMQIGIPNNRRRLYMICERSSRFAGYEDAAITEMPPSSRKANGAMAHIGEYVESLDEAMSKELLIDEKTLRMKWMKGLSVVSSHDQLSYCFTSSYGNVMHKSSGSLLHTSSPHALESTPLDRSDMSAHAGHIRFFAPKELLNFLGFPRDFHFPPDFSLEQAWKLAGQSVNVDAVRVVMELLFLAHALPPMPEAVVLTQNCQVLGAVGNGQ